MGIYLNPYSVYVTKDEDLVFTGTYLEFWCEVDELAFFRLCVEKNLLNNAMIIDEVLVTQLVHVAVHVDT